MTFAKVENCLANIARHWPDPKYDVTQRDSDISFYANFFERLASYIRLKLKSSVIHFTRMKAKQKTLLKGKNSSLRHYFESNDG